MNLPKQYGIIHSLRSVLATQVLVLSKKTALAFVTGTTSGTDLNASVAHIGVNTDVRTMGHAKQLTKLFLKLISRTTTKIVKNEMDISN